MRDIRLCIRRSRLFLTTVYLVSVLVCQSWGEVVFSDNFESGNLNLWTIAGRRQGMANVADVVDRHGSKMGHLYHQGFSEISIEKTFDFNENLAFSFDFEANVTGGDYASGDALFFFLDSGQNRIGLVGYIKSTSSYIFDFSNPMPDIQLFRIPNEAGLVSYTTSVKDLLSYITIDEESICSVKLRFNVYGSANDNRFTSSVWVDNVVVTPEPTTICLLGLGALSLIRRKSNNK